MRVCRQNTAAERLVFVYSIPSDCSIDVSKMHHMAWNTTLGIYKLLSLACTFQKVLSIKSEERSRLSTRERVFETNNKKNPNQQTTTTFVAIELCHSCCGRHGLSGGNMQG